MTAVRVFDFPRATRARILDLAHGHACFDRRNRGEQVSHRSLHWSRRHGCRVRCVPFGAPATVAIKFLSGDAGSRSDAAERFRREARAAARIHSEHVARVLDIELLNNRIPYMVMELLEGHDLERELEQVGPLPVALAVDYVLQAIEAIAEAHATGVVHRDLKPTNLFLARRPDGARVVKVLDFGISKLTGPGYGPDAALTRSASIFGSPLYMSPEQMRSSKDVDARADIWAPRGDLVRAARRAPAVRGRIDAGAVPRHPQRRAAARSASSSPTLPRRSKPSWPNAWRASPPNATSPLPIWPRRWRPSRRAGQAHAERARRTLRHSAAGLGGATTRMGPELVPQVPRGSTPAAPDVRGTPPPTPAPTQSSWGKTGGRAIVNRRTYAIGIALVLLVGGGARWPGAPRP